VTSSIVMEGDGLATEYAGGYSDYQTQRRVASKEASTLEKKNRPSATITELKPKKTKKLSYKDQRDLDNLPAEVEALSMKISDMEAALSDPDLYQKDPKRFNELSKEIEALRETLEAKEMRWLELEELKDSLSSA